jgi:hypothetical protein
VSDRWSVIGQVYNEETDQLSQYIIQKTGIEPKYFAMYSTMAAFIRHAGIDEARPVAFRNGHYIGTLDDIKRILG